MKSVFIAAMVLLPAPPATLHAAGPSVATPQPSPKPNFVLVFVDNLGNGDLGCFGSKLHQTPNVDRMAAEGTKFTSFYVASGVCTPSRAALMTGCYPRRVNLHVSGANTPVLRAADPKGLNPDEKTIAEVLKQAGYATGIFGKWHLGDQPPFFSTRQGFDYRMEQLQAVRAGPWKLYLPLEKKITSNNRKTAPSKLELYDVRNDASETQEVSGQHSDMVKRLLALADRTRTEIGDMDKAGRGQRPAGWVDNPKPLRLSK